MIAVYIASPYAIGDQAVNVRESLVIAEKLVHLGYVPFTPLLTHFWHFLSPHSHKYWLDLDLAWVKRCDVLLRWLGESRGADQEVVCAYQNHIPVVYTIEELLEKFPVNKE